MTEKHSVAPGLDFAGRWLDLSVPRVMGILNVTPDSFSDGGVLSLPGSSRFQVSLDSALSVAERMVGAGVSIIDIGGESTRPGAPLVSEQEELDRVVPIVDAIHQRFDVLISVDTSTPVVITQAASVGAGMVNDVRALQRLGALQAAAASRMAVCLMHMQGDPQTMQEKPCYNDVFAEVCDFLHQRITDCLGSGIAPSRVCLDPGFGFGKSLEHNYHLLARLGEMRAFGLPLLAGLSRKSMIGAVVNKPVDQRSAGSLAGAVLAAVAGASIVRVHDVAETVDAMKVVSAMQNYGLQ
jgi:dihydropteroate synthase